MVVDATSFITDSIYNGRSLSLRDHAISFAENNDFEIQLFINSLSPSYMITSQSLKRANFSIHLSAIE